MANILETPPDFPDLEDVEEGDTKKFIVEAKCISKEEDGAHQWEAVTIDGVKPETQEEEADEDEGIDENYDTSEDEGGEPEDFTPSGKPKTTKGIGMLIVSGKPK